MANRAYLAVSNLDSLYPSLAEQGYNPARQLVATQEAGIPLLWLTLFREGDLRRQVLRVNRKEIRALAPICRREKALGQLREGIAHLERILPGLGPLCEYGALFGKALEAVDFEYVTLEVGEIAELYPKEHRFEEILTLALRGFDRPDEVRFACPDVKSVLDEEDSSLDLAALGDIPPEIRAALGRLHVAKSDRAVETVGFQGFTANSHAELLGRVTGIPGGRVLPPVRMLLDGMEYSPADLEAHKRILGLGKQRSTGCGMEVPWERKDSQVESGPDD